MKNYLGTHIPEIDSILKGLPAFLETLDSLKRYSFNQFYNLSNRNEYNINTEFVNCEFKNAIKEKKLMGIYIFYDDSGNAVYVGISRTVIHRIKQHMTSNHHTAATLAYLIARTDYEKETGEVFPKQRKDLDKSFVPIQDEMKRRWSFSIIPFNEEYEMYVNEVVLACHLKTKWNSFKTH